MSFEIFVQWFDKGEKRKVPVAIIEAAFAEAALVRSGTFRQLRYPDGGEPEIWIADDSGDVSSMTIVRPPPSPPFWRSLYSLLQDHRACLYWPDSAVMIARSEFAADLPGDMIKDFGPPLIVNSAQDILAELRRT